MAFKDFIIEYPNALEADFCDRVIEKFENDSRVVSGSTAGGVNEQMKVSDDLVISGLSEWLEEDRYFFDHIKEPLQEYTEFFCKATNQILSGFQFQDSGYQIQRTVPGGFYDWHHDFTQEHVEGLSHTTNDGCYCALSKRRYFTYIFYLNDRAEYGEDGRTQFYDMGEVHSITPEKGKLLFFPANPLYVHRGEKLTKGVKYLATGWFSSYHSCNRVSMSPDDYAEIGSILRQSDIFNLAR